MTIYNLGNIKGEKGDKGDSVTGPTGPVGVGIKSIEQITYMKFKFCLTDGSEYIINYGDEPTFDDITVTSTNDILSYADGDSTVLSAQLTNGGQAVSVSGESVTFEVRKVSDDSLVETLTDTTDNTGLASVEYFGKGVGDLSIKCQCRSVIEIYEITDALKYFDTTFTSSQILTVPNLPTNFKCEFKVKGTTGSVTGSACWVEIGSNSDNLILFGRTSGASNTGIFVKVNGNYVVSQQGNSKYQSNDVQYIYEYNNGSQSVNDGSQTVTTTNSQITTRNYVNLNIGTNMYIKELIFLPL